MSSASSSPIRPTLPRELWGHCFGYLSASKRAEQIERVCRAFRQWAQTEQRLIDQPTASFPLEFTPAGDSQEINNQMASVYASTLGKRVKKRRHGFCDEGVKREKVDALNSVRKYEVQTGWEDELFGQLALLQPILKNGAESFDAEAVQRILTAVDEETTLDRVDADKLLAANYTNLNDAAIALLEVLKREGSPRVKGERIHSWIRKNEPFLQTVDQISIDRLQEYTLYPFYVSQTRDGHSFHILNCISEDIGAFKGVRTVKLSHLWIRELPPTFNGLTQTQTLNLSSNELEAIPEIGQLTQLRELDLSGQRQPLVLSGASSLWSLPQLQILRLNDNTSPDLPLEISQLPQLNNLDLSNMPNISFSKLMPLIEALIAKGRDLRIHVDHSLFSLPSFKEFQERFPKGVLDWNPDPTRGGIALLIEPPLESTQPLSPDNQ